MMLKVGSIDMITAQIDGTSTSFYKDTFGFRILLIIDFNNQIKNYLK